MIEALVEPKTSCLVALCVFRAVHSDIKEDALSCGVVPDASERLIEQLEPWFGS